MTTNTPIAEAMEPYLANGDQNRSGAETSIKINIDLWRKHLEGFPLPADIRVRSDGTITRGELVRLAEVARREGTDESVMALFWTVLAWGLAGSWRNVGRLVADVRNDVGGVITALRESSAAAYAGDPGTGFEILHRRVDRWGPAYFTKFLHFSADFDDPAKVQPLILDSRVQVAWRAFAGEWLDTTSARDYVSYCQTVHEIARDRGCQPGWIEGRLYRFGRDVGSYERLIDARLELCAARLGPEDTPSIADAWDQVSDGRRYGAIVAAQLGGRSNDYEAWRAPSGSVHDGVWYAQETPR